MGHGLTTVLFRSARGDQPRSGMTSRRPREKNSFRPGIRTRFRLRGPERGSTADQLC